MTRYARLFLRVLTLLVCLGAILGGASNANAATCHSSYRCADTWFGDDYCYINASTVGWSCIIAGSECIEEPHLCSQTG